MKKLLLLCVALVAVLTSCANDDSSENSFPEDSSILPKTISYTYPDISLGTNSKITLSYDGNKILTSVEDDTKTIFTYTGNVITRQEKFDVDSKGIETKDIEVNYTYENGKLKTRVTKNKYPDGEYIGKTVYIHTSENLVSFTNYSVNSDTKIETKINDGSLTYENGNLIKYQSVNGNSVSTRFFEYDGKNNPCKNILGFNLLLLDGIDFSVNNILKINRVETEFPDPVIYLTTYVYNDKNYPIKHTSFAGDGKSIEYEIEYTY